MVVAPALAVAPPRYIPVAPVTLNNPYAGKNVIMPPIYFQSPVSVKHSLAMPKNAKPAPKPVKILVRHPVAKHPVMIKTRVLS
jgi:hypothetical protein